ncbi:DNA methyltransferase [Helicobacter salomonis]|uniref:DNA methyltransferase n=1 Tax=Helicobacter salomonis TaxID=56878 RepID=UPI000CF0ED43|nr:DNA methyltransferase [Helicobacter salomonis]
MQDFCVKAYKTCKQHSYREFSKIHSMASYLAMFPPILPYFFIAQYSQENDLIYDPFAGRGTVPFEACRMGRIGIGNDLSPLAFCLIKAKINIPETSKIKRRLKDLARHYAPPDIEGVDTDIKVLFEERLTLPQLVYLKQSLKLSRSVDNFIMATLAGILHGKCRKDGTSMYCSIDMPNTFSMAPNYIRGFVAKHDLKKLRQDVFQLLEHRIDSLFTPSKYPQQNMSHYQRGYCFSTDALKCSQKVIKKYGQNAISLIITSPPYLKNISYGKYNWIRFWLFQEDFEGFKQNKYRLDGLKDNLIFEKYAHYLQELFNSWAEVLKPGGRAVVVIGDLHTLNLAQKTWDWIQANGGCALRLESMLEDNPEYSGKTTRIWGAKKGQATKVDRILMLKKD